MVGAGIGAAVLAAAAGAYFLYGKDGAKHRKKVRSWALRVKAEVMDRMEGMKEMTEEAYYSILDNVQQKYATLKEIPADELIALMGELRGHWKNLKRDAHPKKASRSGSRKVTTVKARKA